MAIYGIATDHLLADWAELSSEARHEVRDFIAFKRVQQETREARDSGQRWRPDDDGSGGGDA